MSLLQPQRPRSEIDALVEVLSSAIEDRSATYLSLPITNGPRFLEWYVSSGRLLERDSEEYRAEHRRRVLEPNCAAARELIQRLRREERLVVEPTAFDPEGWSQPDFRYFWGRVIERYAEKVVFMDGWEHSSGCGYEFLKATEAGVDRYTERGEALSVPSGTRLLEEAISRQEQCGIDVSFLRRVLAALKSGHEKKRVKRCRERPET